MRWEDYYQQKAKDSFVTYFRIALFQFIITGREKEFSDMDGQSFANLNLGSGTLDYYIHAYWQDETGEEIEGKTIKDIISSMDAWNKKSKKFNKQNKEILNSFESSYIKRFESIFPKEEFEKLYKAQECAYCGISEDEIMQLAKKGRIFKKSERGWHLEIDRKDSNKEYTPKNCVRCCYWCNNAKTDEFNEEEFKPIAEGIRKVWVERGIERLRVRL
jgi:hypothetical protein